MNLASFHAKIARLPAQPGVYLFKDAGGEILYVGKASDLKHRVASYFQAPGGKDFKTLGMLEKAADLDYLVTGNEKEAFLLEDNLIKQHHPRYNVRLRDDKNYPLLRLSAEEEAPILSIVRRVRHDGALYFGPYSSARSVRETLKWIRQTFAIRTSLDTKFSPRLPSWGKADPARYRETVRQVRLFLEGKNEGLIDRMKREMEAEAARMNYEAAARIRDRIGHIRSVLERQRIVSARRSDLDVIGLSREGSAAALYLLFIRGGKLLGGKGFLLPHRDLSGEEVLESFLHQYYQEGKVIPQSILLPLRLDSRALIERWLAMRRGGRVRILDAGKGEKRSLLDLARQNAAEFLSSQAGVEKGVARLLQSLKEDLRLGKIPRRIEAFDISDILGEYAVGSMVCFEDNRPAPEKYTRFRIRTISGADDYAMMREVLLRRYRKAQASGNLPDLVLLDGGRGQLNAGLQAFRELGISGVDLLSLAKEREQESPSGAERTGEKIFHPDFPEPFQPPKHSPLLNFLDRVRDEAHRFAISYHKKLRGKGALHSQLGEIPGIGPIRRKALLGVFGTVKRIREAGEDELARVPRMNRQAARKVHRFFHPTEEARESS